MSKLDARLIRRSLAEGPDAALAELELFGSIASTNPYLLAQPAPEPGRFRVAIADHQTAGRGRHYRRWMSPPGAGLCLSLAYTFEEAPEELPCLTLAIGVGILNALEALAIKGVRLKWPNDLVARDGKLGGILTELQSRSGDGVTVVIGCGLNIDLPEGFDTGTESDWAREIVDLKSIAADVPEREVIAAAVINGLYDALRKFETHGFGGFANAWSQNDWLRDRQIVVDLPDGQISGIAAGVDTDGALLVNQGTDSIRVVTGSIVMAGPVGASA